MLIEKRKSKDLKEYNLNKKLKTMIVFDDMIVDMLSNKRLFIKGRKLNIFLFFILFDVPKNFKLIPTGYFIIKVPNKLELQQNPLIIL